MASAASDRYTLGSDAAFTARVQILGQKQARTILENASGTGDLVAGVRFSDAANFASRFLTNQGFWAGVMALDIVNDGGIEAFWTDGTPGSYGAITDAAIAGILPYTFAIYRNVP